MDIEKKLIKKSSLEELVTKMNQDGKQVYAPVKKNDVVDFNIISSYSDIEQDYIVTKQSAKSIIFPRVESLFEMETSKDGVSLKDKDIDSIPEVVLIGARPCDTAGLTVLTAMFQGDLIDSIYTARFNKTTIIGVSCKNKDDKCFCTSVKGGPGDTNGSDILLTEINDGDYLAEIITEKGKVISEKYKNLFETAPEVNKDEFLADVPVEFDFNSLTENIYSTFDNDIWVEQSLRCIGCGACAYVCPTCGCFDIQDVMEGNKGQRKRSWDSCGFSLFTLHASGHNPREVQSARWRQRLLHKFSYMLEQQNTHGCVGCGRCSRSCSVDMNLKEHLINLTKEIAK